MSVARGHGGDLMRDILLYGPFGAGKTTLAISSFWDFEKEEPVSGRTGRILMIGGERNDDLGIPDEMVRRFRIDPKDWLGFAEGPNGLESWLQAMQKQSAELGFTDLVLDGITELGTNYIEAHNETYPNEVETYSPYGAWFRFFKRIMRLLDVSDLGCNIFVTAGVTEGKKGGTTARGKPVQGDPAWMEDFKYIPNLIGQAKDRVGHYFSRVVYMESDMGKPEIIEGKAVPQPVHTSRWVSSDRVLIKNTAEHKWPSDKHVMENVTWPEVEAILEAL